MGGQVGNEVRRRYTVREPVKPLPITRRTRTWPLTERLDPEKDSRVTAIGFTAEITAKDEE